MTKKRDPMTIPTLTAAAEQATAAETALHAARRTAARAWLLHTALTIRAAHPSAAAFTINYAEDTYNLDQITTSDDTQLRQTQWRWPDPCPTNPHAADLPTIDITEDTPIDITTLITALTNPTP